MYARSLEALGKTEAALAEYEVLATSFPGEEGRYRYAQLLTQQGKQDAAQRVYQEILQRASHSPKYYRKKEKRWIALAKQQSAQQR